MQKIAVKNKLLSIFLLAILSALYTSAEASIECLYQASVVKKSADDCVALGGAYIPSVLAEKYISKDLKNGALAQSEVSQYQLAGILLRNSMNDKDRQLALVWYELAANQNYVPALLSLAYLHTHGTPFVQRDVAKSIIYYHRATGQAKQNNAYVSATMSLHNESMALAALNKLREQRDGSKLGLERSVARIKLWKQELQSIEEGLAPMGFIEDQLITYSEELEALRKHHRSESTEIAKTIKAAKQLSAALEQGANREQITSGIEIINDDVKLRRRNLNTELSQIALQQRQYEQALTNVSHTPAEYSDRLAFKQGQDKKAAYEQYLHDQEQKIQREKATAERRRKKLEFLEKRIAKLKSENKRTLSADETVVMQRALTEISQRYQGKLNYLSASVEQETENVAKLTSELSSVEALSQEKDRYIAAVKRELTASSSLVREQSELVKVQSKNLDEAIKEMKAAHPKSNLVPTGYVKSASNQTNKALSATAPKVVVKWPQFTEQNGLRVANVEANSKINLVGAVSSDSQITDFSINQQTLELDSNGLFLETIEVKRKPVIVDVLAMNEYGALVEEKFLIRPTLPAKKQPVLSKQAKDIKDIDFGNYYAVVIGNNQYQAEHFQPLETAVHDAQSVAQVLESKYGFHVRLLLNASRDQTLKAFEEMRTVLTEKDNLLIYYAGHGVIDPESDQGYWLPTDASSDTTSRWISNATITDHVRALSSKNIMLVADSCYSGSLMRGTSLGYRNGLTAEKLAQRFKNDILLTTRVVLSSGGLQPVVDSIGNSRNSIFTSAMLKALNQNETVLDANSLATAVSRDVVLATKDNVRQVPRFAPLLRAGHEGGEFYFVPLEWRSQ